jgi:uncharacterized protein (DUF1330 family)
VRGLVFHYDNAEVLDRKAHKRLLKQWTHTAKAFGIDHLLIIGEAPEIHDAEIVIDYYEDYQQIREAYPDNKYVVIIESGKPLGSVKLPKDALYVLGSNYADPIVNEKDITVSIKADIPLWDVVAAGIVLHKAK